MIDLPPELASLELPQYRPAMEPKEKVKMPWTTEEEFTQWLENPVWLRRAFTADKDHLNSVLMSKPLGDLLAAAYIKSIRNSVHRVGLSFLGSFTGPHRTGKSVSACLFAHYLDPTFWPNFEHRVIQSPYQFMTCMENIIKDEIIGAAIVVDEAGTTFSSGDWYEKWMKTIQKFLQVCGLLKPIILFVAPNREFIVSGMRKLIVAEHHMKKYDKEFARMSCYNVKYNFMKKGDPYFFRRPVIRIGGQTITLKHINVFEPPAWFVNRYRNLTEPDKKSRLTAWTAEVQKIITNQEDEGEPDYDALIEEIWNKKEIFFGRLSRDGNQKVDQTQLEIQYNLKPKHAKYIAERIERRLAENAAQKEDMLLLKAQREEEKMNVERAKRMKALKNLPADDLAPAKTEERATQKETMAEGVEEILSDLKD